MVSSDASPDYINTIPVNHIGGAIAQSVEQWSRNPVTRVRNQGDALVPFDKASNPHCQVPRRDLKPSAVWLLTYKHLICFLSSQQ